MINLYIETLSVLQRAFARIESKIDKPAFVKRGSYHVFRYEKQSIEAAVIQKLARVISGLHASLLLLSGGFVQELGVIFRTLDEFNEDILFLCQAIRTGKVTELHRKYLDIFYQEEFDKIYKYHLVKMATYLNTLADLNLLKKGKLSAIRMDLYSTLGCDRFMFLVYPAFDKDMTREKLNEILKIDSLIINTGIIN